MLLISYICTAGSDKWVSFYCLLVLDKVLGLIPVAHNAFQAQDVFLTTASNAFHNTVVFSKAGTVKLKYQQNQFLRFCKTKEIL